ncbi:MAG TPA: alpha/beta hydrolase-fold protein [Gemmataceae bacterium]|nr:alpha/beta hydrolase-fold protein [Gemmataceae bacterium]
MATTYRAILSVLALVLCTARAPAGVADSLRLYCVEHKIAGQILDFTHNHGSDNRVWSESLCQKRDLYVYLPPCYDPAKKYPVIFLFHGFAQDERMLLLIASSIDAKIQDGCLPPTIVVSIDGTISGDLGLFSEESFYVNSKAGRFEDYVMCDVWNWAHANFSIRPEREAHVFAGASMGGGAAFNLGLKHRDRVAVAAGIFPPLNIRWLDCHGNYFGKFDPCCWGWREKVDRRREMVARFALGLIRIPIGRLVTPVFGFDGETVRQMSRENPIEQLDRYGVKDGELAMYVAYAGHDEFNLDAQAESFLYMAKERGIHVDCAFDRWGHHNQRTAFRMLPATLDWIGQQLARLNCEEGSMKFAK